GEADRTAHRADDGECAGAARAAARLVRRRQPGTPRQRHGSPGKARAFPRSQRLCRAGTVMEPGEYAMRGGIIDIFPAGETDPVRLDLFGDTIESIRIFDPTTQRSSD